MNKEVAEQMKKRTKEVFFQLETSFHKLEDTPNNADFYTLVLRLEGVIEHADTLATICKGFQYKLDPSEKQKEKE